MCETTLSFPGAVDGVTGELVRAPCLEEAARLIAERPMPSNRRDVFGDPLDLSDVGWGIVFDSSVGPDCAIRKALLPLLELRRGQAGQRYREYLGSDGYQARESYVDFLARHKTAPSGKVDPKLVPYYLLLVGGPEVIPYRFQYELDIQYAVGRICFDTVEEYRSYAASVLAAERVAERSRKRVAFFGPLHDEGTRLTNNDLLAPLIRNLQEKPDAEIREVLGKDATKAGLARLLGGEERPDLLFTAGHGVFYGSGHERQRTHQGALVCQDWPGTGAPEPEHVFAGEDVRGDRQGLLAFFFACNSAGTPDYRDFAPEDGGLQQAAPRPFVSALAQRLLGAPGGALAVVGHVERVWRCSFLWRDTGSQPQPFLEMLKRLLAGEPLGWALEPVNQRHAELAACLSSLLKDHFVGLPVDEKALAELWVASQDARNYVVVGDPAVRLPFAAEPAVPERVTRG
jgi:hypothetical protein